MRPSATAGKDQISHRAKSPVNTEAIISRNLFDPERGAGATRVAEATSQAFQRVQNLILLGTAIIGNDRFAVLRDGATNVAAARVGQSQSPAVMRVKLGESLEGFRLSEVTEEKVVFTKGVSRVEVLLDYFRKPDATEAKATVSRQAGRPRSVAPRVVPNLPRRDRLPVQRNPNPNR
jgi:hypothetical protein